MRRDGEPPISWARRWVDHRCVHSCVLLSRDRKGWESNPDKLHLGTRLELDTIGTWKDSWASISPPSLATIDFLCSGVHETHSLRLDYCAVDQHEAATQ